MGIKPIFLGDKSMVSCNNSYNTCVEGVWMEYNNLFSSIIRYRSTLYRSSYRGWCRTLETNYSCYITGISSIIILMMTLSLGGILSAGFDQIYNLYNPIVYQSGDIIDTFVFRMSFNQHSLAWLQQPACFNLWFPLF